MRLGNNPLVHNEPQHTQAQPLSPVSFEQLEPRLLLSASLITPVDNSAVLTGYVTQDIVIETQFDWLSAELTVTPDQPGSIFQSPFGGDGSPTSAWFAQYPELEYDTFVSSGDTADGPRPTFIGDFAFNTDEIGVTYYTMAMDDIGTLTLARITLDENASGTWSFLAYTSPAQVPTFAVSGYIVNGRLIQSGLLTEVSITIDASNRGSFQDQDGDLVTISLRGNGSAEVFFDDVGPRDVSRIVLSGTDYKSSLTIATKGETSVGQILIEDGSLGKILGKTTDIVGAGIEATGSGAGQGYVGSIQVRDFKNGADVVLPGAGALKGVTVKVSRIYADTDITLGSYLKSFTAFDWVGGSLASPWASKIAIKGDRRAGIIGDLGADMTFTGVDPRKGLSLGKLQVAGTLSGSTIRTQGGIGTIMLGAIENTDVLAGIYGSVLRHAEVRGDFANLNAYIKSVKVKGLKLPKGAAIPRFVSNSNFSAASIGSVSMMNVDWDNGNEPFGIWAYDSPLSSQEIKSVSYKDSVTGERWKWPLRDGEVFDIPDLMIEII